MLFDPEKPTVIDADTVVITDSRRDAQRKCREIAEIEQQRGEVCEYLDMLPSKSGKSYRCVFSEKPIKRSQSDEYPNGFG